MPDPRCNCAEPDCAICNAPEHTPWTPKAGVSPDPKDVHIEQLLRANTQLMARLKANRWDALRRYLLVLLMTGLGSMIGSAITLSMLK